MLASNLAHSANASSFLAPVYMQGRGGSTGYDNAVALPARADEEELLKENVKKTGALKGSAVFSVAKVGRWRGAGFPAGWRG